MKYKKRYKIANKYSTLHSPIITKLLKTGFQPNCGATEERMMMKKGQPKKER